MLGLCLVALFTIGAAAAVPALASKENEKRLEKLYSVYKNCPINNPVVNECIFAQTAGGKNGGQYTVGSITVPLSKSIVLQGGVKFNEETGEEVFIAPETGGALEAPPLKVPGGLAHRVTPQPFWPTALKESYESAKANQELTATETLELAGEPGISRTNLLEESGTAFYLPMKVHVNSPWLTTLGGNTCYVGSNEHPIIVKLTTGQSTGPFPYEFNTGHGSVGNIEFFDEFADIVLANSTLVDDEYAVSTGAEGCGGEFASYIDPAISAAAGVPAPSGANNVVLKGTLNDTEATRLIERREKGE